MTVKMHDKSSKTLEFQMFGNTLINFSSEICRSLQISVYFNKLVV